jgi:hypothetical protein
MLRSHSFPPVLHHIPYWTGYEEPTKNTDKILKSEKEGVSFDQYWEFCNDSLELVHSEFIKHFVNGPHPY